MAGRWAPGVFGSARVRFSKCWSSSYQTRVNLLLGGFERRILFCLPSTGITRAPLTASEVAVILVWRRLSWKRMALNWSSDIWVEICKTRMAFQTNGTERQIPRGKHWKPGAFETGVRSSETQPARASTGMVGWVVSRVVFAVRVAVPCLTSRRLKHTEALIFFPQSHSCGMVQVALAVVWAISGSTGSACSVSHLLWHMHPHYSSVWNSTSVINNF